MPHDGVATLPKLMSLLSQRQTLQSELRKAVPYTAN